MKCCARITLPANVLYFFCFIKYDRDVSIVAPQTVSRLVRMKGDFHGLVLLVYYFFPFGVLKIAGATNIYSNIIINSN